MTTFTALTTLTGREAAENLASDLERMAPEPTGIGTFEIEDGSGTWEVGAYFQGAPDPAGLALLAAMHGAKPFVVSELPEEDWVAKVRRELTPVEAGRFFVYGSHDTDKVPQGCIPLLIEASMAFGTGHHGTTQGCLLALDQLLSEAAVEGPVLDLGCGTAVLAMAAAHEMDSTVLASDIDEVAVEVARANLAANDMVRRVECHEAAGLDHAAIARAAPYGLIFANILKAPLIALSPGVTDALRPGGIAILSGILNEQADEVVAVYCENGNREMRRLEIGEWTTTILQKNAKK
ncbi:MAG: 50S ribosomal protein L11 methyltransferase [Pseudomonadota bacterium]